MLKFTMQTSVFFVLIDCYEADDPDTGDCLGLFLKNKKS